MTMQPPSIIQPVSQQEIFAELMDRLSTLLPDLRLDPSDPLYLDRWDLAGYEALRAQYFNARLLGAFVNYARGSDLDNLLALNGVSRLAAEANNDDAFRQRGLQEPFTRIAGGSEAAIKAHALAAHPIIQECTLQLMDDHSCNIYLRSSEPPVKLATDRITKKEDFKTGRTIYYYLNLCRNYINHPSRAIISMDLHPVVPIYMPYNIKAEVKFNSDTISLTEVTQKVGAALNQFVLDRCTFNTLIAPSDIVAAIEHSANPHEIIEAVVTEPTEILRQTADRYDRYDFPPHLEPKSGVANPKPFLPLNATDAHKAAALDVGTAWYCYPDALDDPAEDIQVTYTDVKLP